MLNPPLPAPIANKEPGPYAEPLLHASFHLTPLSPQLPTHPTGRRRLECAPFDMPRAKVSNLDTLAPPVLRLSSAALPSPGRTKAVVPLPLVPSGSGPLQEGIVPFLSCLGYNHLAQGAWSHFPESVLLSLGPPAGRMGTCSRVGLTQTGKNSRKGKDVLCYHQLLVVVALLRTPLSWEM